MLAMLKRLNNLEVDQETMDAVVTGIYLLIITIVIGTIAVIVLDGMLR